MGSAHTHLMLPHYSLVVIAILYIYVAKTILPSDEYFCIYICSIGIARHDALRSTSRTKVKQVTNNKLKLKFFRDVDEKRKNNFSFKFKNNVTFGGITIIVRGPRPQSFSVITTKSLPISTTRILHCLLHVVQINDIAALISHLHFFT